jgi:1L-myo-inositol 1-phosphate cytidylyltransferase
MIRNAVILAAGMGTRLREEGDVPKPLFPVGGVPLIKRTILTLANAGVTRIVVVTGFMADRIRGAIVDDPTYRARGIQIDFAHNTEHTLKNGVSVIVGGRVVCEPFVLSMADHIYTQAIARIVATCDITAADLFLATDPRVDQILDIDDATKVLTESGRIVDIGKTIPKYDRIDCGVFAVTPRLVEALEVLRAEQGDCSLSEGVKRLAASGAARVVDIGSETWQDVDTPADRAHVERLLAKEGL